MRVANHGMQALALLFFASTASAQFTLFSQNALHLGWGRDSYYTNKNTYLTTSVINKTTPNFDVGIIQEVMNGNELDTLYPQSPPGTYMVISTVFQGASTYREAYSFLVRNPTSSNTCCTLTKSTGNASITLYGGGGFSRPPSGIVVSNNGTETWVINYHAVFGNISSRRTEVANMALAIPVFQGVNVGSSPGHKVTRYIVGGDWNFPADDSVFTTIRSKLTATVLVQPTALTSLKRNGDMSSAYDHFLWDTATGVTATSPAVVQPPGGKSRKDFRDMFSDHLGISISVN
ncbi:MAG: putative deoxyribonuclease [Candidatus Solibacter sp.]|jgi:hypothetical protein|nr:putative deoxyribonuclease [Candidatus Solibacter sp.]